MVGSSRKFLLRRNRDSRRRITYSKIPSMILPDKTMVKLPLERQITLNVPITNTFVTYDVPLNYIDPTTFVSVPNDARPLGLINWSNFYGATRILGSRISFEAFLTSGNATSQGNVPFIIGVFPTEEYLTGTGTGGAAGTAQAYSKYRSITSANNGGANKARISSYMSTKKMAGQKVTTENDFQQEFEYTAGQATAITTQNERYDWIIFAQTMDGNAVTSSGGANFILNIKVIYYVQLEDRLPQTQIGGVPTTGS